MGQSSQMVIVFDSGPFAVDRSMKNRVSRALLAECEQGRIRVVVPLVVLEEVTSATRGYLQSAASNVSSARHNLGETFLTPPQIPTLDVDSLTDAYRDEIEVTLTGHDVEIVGWEHVSHEEIIERDLARRRPFDDSGRGYRDTLIWHVIRDLVLDESERVILITRDHDFSVSGDDQETLHPDLLNEIGGDDEAIIIVPDIASAIRHVGHVREDLRQAVATAIDDKNTSVAFEALTLLQHLYPYGLDASEVGGELIDVEVDDVVEAWGVLTAVARADLSFEYVGLLNEAEVDYYYETDSLSDDWVDELDWDEEQRSATISGSGIIPIRFELTAEREDGLYVLDVVSAELLEADEEP